MAILARIINKVAFLLSCLRPRSRGTSTARAPLLDENEYDTTSIEEAVHTCDSQLVQSVTEPTHPVPTPSASVSLVTSDYPPPEQATSVPPEPLPDTNPTRPSCERQRRTVPLRMKSKGKEAEDIMELRLEDSGVGLSSSLRLATSMGRYSRCLNSNLSASGMSFVFNSTATATVQLERLVFLSNQRILGIVTVGNLAFHKEVYVRWTSNGWQTFTDTPCKYQSSDIPSQRDIFGFQLSTTGPVELCVCYTVLGQSYYDNNNGQNYTLL